MFERKTEASRPCGAARFFHLFWIWLAPDSAAEAENQ